MRSRITIGDFSRASQLSVKTLRHYHEVGLLEPSEVDPGNGYRYYTGEQIPQAQVIRRLRGLQMPVAEVKAVLSTRDSDARNQLIVEHLNRLEAELKQTRAAVSELRDLLERPETSHPVEHRSVRPTPSIGIRATVEREDILVWWQGALGELRATVRAQALEQTGPSGGLYASEIFQFGRGEAIVFIPVRGRLHTVGRVETFTVPAAELAIICHHGPLANADLTYGELGAYVMRHEIGVIGPLRENYLCGFLDSDDPATWETEIGWPIFRSDTANPGPSDP
jgi:DNA-binding transcriptional MerR regulator